MKKIKNMLSKAYDIAWKRHHLIIPPVLLKRYFKTFIYNLKNNDFGKYYNFNNQHDYNNWLLERKEERVIKLSYNPLIIVVIVIDNFDDFLYSSCLKSIENQTYKNFKICIMTNSNIKNKFDFSIKCVDEFSSILKFNGEYFYFIDSNDVISVNCLYEFVKSLNNEKSDLIYSDEDMLIDNKRCNPFFKVSFSPHVLLSYNCIKNSILVKRSLLNKINYDNSLKTRDNYDMILKLTEKTKKIRHISKVLYHTSKIEINDLDTRKKIIEEALKRRNLKGCVKQITNTCYFDIEYLYSKEPTISIIIPTRNYYETLKMCITSIYEKTNYSNYEVIVVDNNSDDEKTIDYINFCKSNYKNFKSIRIEEEFNYSRLNNKALEVASGDFILLLNNDTEVISNNWLKDMVSYAMLDDVGCVGVKLLYFDNTIQHCGVVLNKMEVATHISINAYKDDIGIYGNLIHPINYMATTAACLMVKKSLYQKVNGLDEKLKVAFNDVDFCLKVFDEGYYNVVLPKVLLYHYESKSRGLDNTTKKYERYVKEVNYMNKKWNKYLENDLFYNKNFSMKKWYMLEKTKK